ncbi:MAG: restriction endonuclease subunit S, partial [Inhella sp.]
RVSVGHVGPTTEHFSDAPDGILFLRSQNVRPGKLELETALSITPTFHRSLKKSQLRPGDILFVRVGANRGDCCVVPEGVGELNCANIVFARPKEPTGFHAFFFQSALGRSFLLSASVGAAQGVINTGSVAAMPVPLPPLPIQRRIASILSAYDELIENSQRRIKILESMARALYREWFVQFRFPGHQSVPLVPSPLGEIPEGWEVRPFSGLASYVNGYAFKPDDWGDEGKPIIKIKELKAGVTADTPRNSGDGIPDKYNIRDGDVLFSWSDDLDAYLWMGGEGLLNQHLFNVLPFDGVSRAYCFHSLKEAMPRFRALSLGATMHHIKRSALDQVATVVPPAALRKRFEGFVEPIHEQLIALTNEVQTLRRTRDLLLPRMLSGQIDVEAIAP